MTIKLEKEMNDMCNLSAGIREEGFREGERRGKRKGEHKGKLETLRNMIVDGLTTIEALKATGCYTAEELSAVAASLHQEATLLTMAILKLQQSLLYTT